MFLKHQDARGNEEVIAVTAAHYCDGRDGRPPAVVASLPGGAKREFAEPGIVYLMSSEGRNLAVWKLTSAGARS